MHAWRDVCAAVPEIPPVLLPEAVCRPTVSQFAETIGISQPNATYKVNQLTAKGYLEKHVQARDRREVVLTTSEKFTGYFDEDKEDALQQKIRTAAAQFTPAELDSAERVLLALEALL